MKMLMFDFRDSEKSFFEKTELPDFDITFIKEPLNEHTKLTDEQLRETDVISIFTGSNLTEDVLSKFPNLRVVATRSTGFNHIDLQYCTKLNIAVFNVEHYGRTAVAEYAAGLMIALVRNMLPAAVDMKNCEINHALYEGHTLNNMTIGIIGCGSIGSAVAEIARFFGMRVLINTYMKNPDLDDSCKYVTLDELLEQSDIISLHAPYTGDNYHMLGAREFNKMKDGVYIINTARGELIDISALYENLVKGKVKGAGLDVLECEFLANCPAKLQTVLQNTDSECVSTALISQKLFSLKNVIITPHIAYNTNESINYLLEATFNNIRDYLKGMRSNNRVC